ncbi:MAG: hypothetical protein AABX82_01280 [Nanoarchaeota archaeon]
MKKDFFRVSKVIVITCLVFIFGCSKDTSLTLYQEAKQLKTEGDTATQNGELQQALDKYLEAIEKSTKASQKSDWMLPKILQKDCKKSIEALKFLAEKKDLFEYNGKFLSKEEYEEALVNEGGKLIAKKKEEERLEEEKRKLEERKREEAEQRRVAEEKRKEEEEKERLRQVELRKMQQEYDAYLPEAQKVLDVLERIGAYLEVGINYSDFGSRIQDLNYQWKKFDEFAMEKGKTGLISYRMLKRATDGYILSFSSWKTAADAASKEFAIMEKLHAENIRQTMWSYAGIFSAKASLTLKSRENVLPDTCPLCKGGKKVECLFCAVAGTGKCPLCLGDGKSISGGTCSSCKGSGKCKECDGTGEVECLLCDGKGVWP